MVEYKPLPKHKPHEVIKSEEWNIIADDLEWLKEQVAMGGGGGAVALPKLLYVEFISVSYGYILVSPMFSHNMFAIAWYFYLSSWDPYYINLWGSIMNRGYAFRKMKFVVTYAEPLDAETEIGLAVNGSKTDLKITIPTSPSEGDIYENLTDEVTVGEGDRVTLYTDGTPASTGSVQGILNLEYEPV